MAHTYSRKEIEERYNHLPGVLQDALFDVDAAEKIFEIGRKHGLTIEKIGFLAEETGYIIMGFMHPREFVNSLAERLELDSGKARLIASDVNHQIFSPLRQSLKETHQMEVTEEEFQKTEPLVRKAAAAPSGGPQGSTLKNTPPFSPPGAPETTKETPRAAPPSAPVSPLSLPQKPPLSVSSAKEPPVASETHPSPSVPKPPPAVTPPSAVPSFRQKNLIDLREDKKLFLPPPVPGPRTMAGGTIFAGPAAPPISPPKPKNQKTHTLSPSPPTPPSLRQNPAASPAHQPMRPPSPFSPQAETPGQNPPSPPRIPTAPEQKNIKNLDPYREPID
jgi:hypothetical protein